MLTDLKIENVAVIEKAQVHFAPGFNVLTGETGAGKSILIDSINVILGNRASREMVRSGASKACIWATFEGIPDTVKAQLEKCGYEAQDDLLLFREINTEGKGSCRVNGMPATAAVVRDICAGLLTIHGQHDSHSLIDPATHLTLLDEFAQNRPLYESYRTLHRELVQIKHRLDALHADEAEKARRIAELQGLVQDVDALALENGEEERLLESRQRMQHAQGILDSLNGAHIALSGSEEEETEGSADLLGTAAAQLTSAAALDPSLAAASEKLNELYYSAKDLAADLADRLGSYEFEPGELEQVEERLDAIYRIKQKYHAEIPELLAQRDAAVAELEDSQSVEEKQAALTAEMKELYGKAKQLAEQLTQSRLTAFEEMNRQMRDALEFLNMPGVRMELMHSRGALASSGQDTVEFLISTNPGEEPKPLAKIASGGELSRIMLAFKSAMADRDAIPTVIYDEIDTGVSGLAAGRIGEKLKATSHGHQVLCITHTAQIAAFADNQLLIKKMVHDGRTFTDITALDTEGRIHTLAAMISGDKVTDLSLANAREMIEKAGG